MDTINPGGDNLYTADQICRMVEFLIDNIFVKSDSQHLMLCHMFNMVH